MGKVVSSKVAKVLIMAAVLLAVAAAAVVAQSASSPSTPSAMGSSSAMGSQSAMGAFGTSKQCYTVPCHGTNNRETIYERIGNGKRDIIRGYGSNDRLHANTYYRDTDQVYGYGGGTNWLFVNDGDTNDRAIGGRGYDYCYVDARMEASNSCNRVVVR